MPFAAGVDLGTTYSAAATAGPEGATVVDLGTRSSVVPSIVAVRADGEILTGEAAERRMVLEPARAAREFKRRLGDPTPLLLGGVPYGAEALTGLLLSSIVDLIAEREGAHPSVVGLSHPANYGSYKLGLLEEAARTARLDETIFVPEPVAAAVHYSQTERIAAGEFIAVYDLGGGTFDVSVVRRTADGFDVVGRPDGLERFGGIDLDEAVLGHVRVVLGEDLLTIDPRDPAALTALNRLRDECRSAKEALSGDTEVAIPVMLPGLHTEVRLTRAEFEDMIRPRIRDTLAVLERTVDSAGITTEQLTRVLLIGGSSRIPLVGEMVREATGRPVGLDSHPKLSVALGCARVAQSANGSPSMPTPVGAPVIGSTTESEPAAEVVDSAEEESPEPMPDVDTSPEPTAAPISSQRRTRVMLGVALIVVIAAVVGVVLVAGRGTSPAEPGTAATASADDAGVTATSEEAAYIPPPVEGPDPSDLTMAFYSTSNRSADFDDGWAVWDLFEADPPEDICCDFYPVLGPYSSNDPAAIDQHFAWFRKANIGIVGLHWYGSETGEDEIVPLILDTAERYGLKVAFVINRYPERSVDNLAESVRYIYDNYGGHPAFYLTDAATPYQVSGQRGLFLLVGPEAESPDPGYWGPAIQAVHQLPGGAVVLAGTTNPTLVVRSDFDGLFNPADPAQSDFRWSRGLPAGAWYVPTVMPGFEQRKSGNAVTSFSRDDGSFYRRMWEGALETGVQPALIAVSSFNNWVEGSQIEPAAAGRDNGAGFTYADYGSLGEEGYLDLTAEVSAGAEAFSAPDTASLRLSISSSSDHTTVSFWGVTWLRPDPTSFEGPEARSWEPFVNQGALSINLQQDLDTAEAGEVVTLETGLQFIGDVSPGFTIRKGCIGVTTVEVYASESADADPLMTAVAQPEDCAAPKVFTVSLAELGLGDG